MSERKPATIAERVAGNYLLAAVFWAVLTMLLVVWPVGVLVDPPAFAVGLILVLSVLGAAFWGFVAKLAADKVRTDALSRNLRAVGI